MVASEEPAAVIAVWHWKVSVADADAVNIEVMVHSVSTMSLHLSPAHEEHPPGQDRSSPHRKSGRSPRHVSTSLRSGPPTMLQVLRYRAIVSVPEENILQFKCSPPV